jgi:hypothetical protein
MFTERFKNGPRREEIIRLVVHKQNLHGSDGV